jgi:hypothetical protein
VEDDAALTRKWPAQGETIALDVGGEAWTTERFARHLGDRMLHGGRALTFAIGGADGLPAALVARAGLRLSLSALTLAAPDGPPGPVGTDLQGAHDHSRRAISPLAARAKRGIAATFKMTVAHRACGTER